MMAMRERLAKLIAERAPVPGHRPWPRYEVDEAAWITVAQELGQGGGDLLGLWGEKDNVHLALRVAGAAFPCVLNECSLSGNCKHRQGPTRLLMFRGSSADKGAPWFYGGRNRSFLATIVPARG